MPQRARRRRQGIDDTAQQRDLQAFLQEHAERQEVRHGTADRQIVDGAVNGQRPDVPAGNSSG